MVTDTTWQFPNNIWEKRDRDMYTLRVSDPVGSHGAAKRSLSHLDNDDSGEGNIGQFIVCKPGSQSMLMFDNDTEEDHTADILAATDGIFRMSYTRWCNEFITRLRGSDRVLYNPNLPEIWSSMQYTIKSWAEVVRDALRDEWSKQPPGAFLRLYARHLVSWSIRSGALGLHLSWLQSAWKSAEPLARRGRQNRLLANSALVIFHDVVCMDELLKQYIHSAITSLLEQAFSGRETDIAALGAVVRAYWSLDEALLSFENVTIPLIHGKPKTSPRPGIDVPVTSVIMDSELLKLVSNLSLQWGLDRCIPPDYRVAGTDVPDADAILGTWTRRYEQWITTEKQLWVRMGINDTAVTKHLAYSQYAILEYWTKYMTPLVSICLLSEESRKSTGDGLLAFARIAFQFATTAKLLTSHLLSLMGQFSEFVASKKNTTLSEVEQWQAVVSLYRASRRLVKESVQGSDTQAFQKQAWANITEALERVSDTDQSGLASYVFSEIDKLLNAGPDTPLWHEIEDQFAGLDWLLDSVSGDPKFQDEFQYRLTARWLPQSEEDIANFDEKREFTFVNAMAKLCGQAFVWKPRIMADEMYRQRLRMEQHHGDPNVQTLLLHPSAWAVHEDEAIQDKIVPTLSEWTEKVKLFDEEDTNENQPKETKWHNYLTIVTVDMGQHTFTCTAVQLAMIEALHSSGKPLTAKELANIVGFSEEIVKAAAEDALINGQGLLVWARETQQYSVNVETPGPVKRLNSLRLSLPFALQQKQQKQLRDLMVARVRGNH